MLALLEPLLALPWHRWHVYAPVAKELAIGQVDIVPARTWGPTLVECPRHRDDTLLHGFLCIVK
jgi:hypothetical protein